VADLMLTPEEDFDTWGNVLMTTIQPGDDYRLLLPSFERLLSSYAEHGHLEGALSEFSTQFSETTVPAVISGVMNLGHLSDPEVLSVKSFMLRAIHPLASLLLRGVPSAAPALQQIFDRGQQYFAKNSCFWARPGTTASVYSELVGEFILRGPMNSICAHLADNPALGTFVILIQLIGEFGADFTFAIGSSLVLQLWKSFVALLSQFDSTNLRGVDSQGLSTILKFIATYATPAFDPEFIAFLFRFGNVCIRCNYLEKQVIGAKLVTSLSGSFAEELRQWAKECQIVDYLIRTELHEKLIAALSPAIPVILTYDKMRIEMLIDLFTRSSQAHLSQKQTLNTFLAQGLRTADPEVVSAFLDSVLQSVNQDLLTFLLAFVQQGSSSNPDACAKIVRFFVNLVENSSVEVDILEAAILKLTSGYIVKEARTVVADYVLTKIPKLDTIGKRYKCFKKLASCGALLGEETRTQMLSAILVNAQAHPDELVYLKIMKVLLKGSVAKLPVEAFPLLLRTHAGCTLFAKLLKVRRINLLDKPSVPILFEALRSLDSRETTAKQYEIIKELVFAFSSEQRKIELFGTGSYQTIKVNDPHIEGIDEILAVAGQARSEQVSDDAFHDLLFLFRAFSPESQDPAKLQTESGLTSYQAN
jgi:hypothetical protein